MGLNRIICKGKFKNIPRKNNTTHTTRDTNRRNNTTRRIASRQLSVITKSFDATEKGKEFIPEYYSKKKEKI